MHSLRYCILFFNVYRYNNHKVLRGLFDNYKSIYFTHLPELQNNIICQLHWPTSPLSFFHKTHTYRAVAVWVKPLPHRKEQTCHAAYLKLEHQGSEQSLPRQVSALPAFWLCSRIPAKPSRCSGVSACDSMGGNTCLESINYYALYEQENIF